MTQELDPKELRKVAEQATPGPWEIHGPANPGPDETLTLHNNDGGAIAYVQPLWDDAEHIATFDPPTVLALLTQLEQAEAQVARVRELRNEWLSKYPDPYHSVNIPGAVDAIDRALDGETRG